MTDYLLKNLFVISYSPIEKGKPVEGRKLSTFMYVETGGYHYISDHVDFTIGEGDAVYVPEGARYKYEVLCEKTKVIQVEFSFEKRDGECTSKFTEHPTPLRKNDYNLKSIFYEMLASYYNNEYQSIAAVYKLMSAISSGENRGRIEPAIDHIEKNYKEKIYMSELAERCSLSESHMRRLFQKYVGMSPVKYKNSLLIKAACGMLLAERLNVGETAEALGFGDVYTFSQLFKKEVGISPKKYAEAMIKHCK